MALSAAAVEEKAAIEPATVDMGDVIIIELADDVIDDATDAAAEAAEDADAAADVAALLAAAADAAADDVISALAPSPNEDLLLEWSCVRLVLAAGSKDGCVGRGSEA